jgi:hypothetical protein
MAEFLFPALAGFEKSLADSSGHGAPTPNRRRGERESARSEGCLAGATERLFESLPELEKPYKNKKGRIFLDKLEK